MAQDTTTRRKATAADFVRHFGNWRDSSREGPVFVTHHGRSTHVLLDIAAYDDLVRAAAEPARDPAGTRAAAAPGGDDPLAMPLTGFIDWLNHGTILCDADLRIRAVNRTAWCIIGKAESDLLGQVLWDVVPQLAGSLSQSYILRCLQTGEPTSADLPSALRPHNWIRLDAFPAKGGVGILFRDITEEVTHNRLANVKETILRAMSLHGEIGYMRLSTVGTIERVDGPLCEMIGLPEDRLTGAGAIDLIARPSRAAFHAELARVMSEGGETRFTCALVSNGGGEVPVRVALVALRGAYAIEGCVAIFTRQESGGEALPARVRGAILPEAAAPAA